MICSLPVVQNDILPGGTRIAKDNAMILSSTKGVISNSYNVDAIVKKAEMISGDGRLTEKEKKAEIESLRKSAGLSKGDMKKYVTGKLKSMYEGAKKRLLAYARSAGIGLSSIKTALNYLSGKAKFFGNMYKTGFWGKLFGGIGKFFKGWGKMCFNFWKLTHDPRKWFQPKKWLGIIRDVIVPIVLNAIPGAGPALSTAYQLGLKAYKAGKAVYHAAKGKFSEVVGDLVALVSSGEHRKPDGL